MKNTSRHRTRRPRNRQPGALTLADIWEPNLDDWLDYLEQLRTSEDSVHYRLVRITPAIADDILEHNDRNRKLNNRRVNRLARDMRNHHWRLSCQGLSLYASDDGEQQLLADGQHRLAAICAADTPQVFVVMFGASEDMILAIDQNFSRSLAANMQIKGLTFDKAKQAALVMFLDLSFAGDAGGELVYEMTQTEKEEAYHHFESSVDLVDRLVPRGKALSIAPIMAAFCRAHYHYTHLGGYLPEIVEQKLISFYGAFIEGNDLPRFVRVFRDQLLAGRARSRSRADRRQLCIEVETILRYLFSDSAERFASRKRVSWYTETPFDVPRFELTHDEQTDAASD